MIRSVMLGAEDPDAGGAGVSVQPPISRTAQTLAETAMVAVIGRRGGLWDMRFSSIGSGSGSVLRAWTSTRSRAQRVGPVLGVVGQVDVGVGQGLGEGSGSVG